METGIFRFFKHFSRIWKTREIYKADKIRERAEPCPIPTLTLKNWEENCSNNTTFFYLLDNLRRNDKPLNYIQLSWEWEEGDDDLVKGRTEQCWKPKCLSYCFWPILSKWNGWEQHLYQLLIFAWDHLIGTDRWNCLKSDGTEDIRQWLS